MLPRPPTSTLFPYTTLFRSSPCKSQKAISGSNIQNSAACRAVLEFSDRKSTRLNSSHRCISYAVFCLKKKKTQNKIITLSHNITHHMTDYHTFLVHPTSYSL